MTENTITKTYDLEDRTYDFTLKVRDFVSQLDKGSINREEAKQNTHIFGAVLTKSS